MYVCMCVCVYIHIYTYLTNFSVHLKPTQHCQSTTVQYNIKVKFKILHRKKYISVHKGSLSIRETSPLLDFLAVIKSTLSTIKRKASENYCDLLYASGICFVKRSWWNCCKGYKTEEMVHIKQPAQGLRIVLYTLLIPYYSYYFYLLWTWGSPTPCPQHLPPPFPGKQLFSIHQHPSKHHQLPGLSTPGLANYVTVKTSVTGGTEMGASVQTHR